MSVIGEYANETKQLAYQEPSKTSLYTIPQGTILYHGSLTRETFNTHDIRLGDDKLIAYFSPSKRIAADYIVGCALYPTKPGFIHKFLVNENIPRIAIISPYEKKDHWTLQYLEDAYCSRRSDIQSNGIGFFFQKDNIDQFNDYPQNSVQVEDSSYEVEFALCNPSAHLTYIGTHRCVAMRQLSDLYKFNGTLSGVDPIQNAEDERKASEDRRNDELIDNAGLPPPPGTSEGPR